MPPSIKQTYVRNTIAQPVFVRAFAFAGAMPGVVDGGRSNAFHFTSPRVCHVINSVIGGTLGFRKSRIGQESSQESFHKKRFGLLGSVSRKRYLTSENVPKCYAAFCVSSALSRRRSPIRIRSELPGNMRAAHYAAGLFHIWKRRSR